MPAKTSRSVIVNRLGSVVGLAQPVHHTVVELQESQVHLGDDQVYVVARVADQRPTLGVAG